MMLKRREFYKYLDELVNFEEHTKQFNVALSFISDSPCYVAIGDHLIDRYVEMLEALTGNTELVKWWVYECDYGRQKTTTSSRTELYNLIKERAAL